LPAEAKEVLAGEDRSRVGALGLCLRRQGPFWCPGKGKKMPAPKKLQIVEELKEQIGRSTITIGAQYQGLRVAEMNALRRQLKARGIEVRVAKNTLLRLAAAAADKPEVAELAEGPTAIVFGYDDAVAAAKALIEYVQSAKSAFQPRRAFLEGRLLSARELSELSALPSRPVLVGKLAGGLQGPLWRLAQLLASTIVQPTGQLLNSSLSDLQGLLQARAGQLEKA
jgi:large subunit ribosomal protein L10